MKAKSRSIIILLVLILIEPSRLAGSEEIDMAAMFLPAEERRELVAAINQRFQAIRASGCPVSLEELNDFYPNPPSGELNAADLYNEAFAKLRRGRTNPLLPLVGDAKLPEPGERFHEDQRHAIEAFLKENQEAMNLIERAVKFPYLRFDLDFREVWEMDVSHLGRLRESARLFALRICLQAEEGATGEIVRDLRTLAAIADALYREPMSFGHLFGVFISLTAVDALVFSLSHLEFSAEELRELDKLVKGLHSPDALTRALCGERTTGIAGFRAVGFGGPWVPWDEYSSGFSDRLISNSLAAYLRASGYWLKDLIFYLDLMDDAIALTKMPPSERRDSAAWTRLDEMHLHAHSKRFYVSSIIYPAHTSVIEIDMTFVNRLNAARIALRLEEWRGALGTYPVSMEEILDDQELALARNLITGESFAYSASADGFTIDPGDPRRGPLVVSRRSNE